MTKEGKEKLTVGVVTALITGVLAVAVALLTKAPVTYINLPDGQSVNADEIAALQSENAVLQSENAALREGLTAQANAVPETTLPPVIEAPTQTSVKTLQYFTDAVTVTDAHNTSCYSSAGSNGKRYFEKAGSYFEIFGKQYANGIKWQVGGTGSLSVHALNGEYTYMEGVLGHIDGTNRENGVLQVYYDNELVRTIQLRYDMPDDLLVLDDIGGVRQLKFIIPEGNQIARYGFGNIKIK